MPSGGLWWPKAVAAPAPFWCGYYFVQDSRVAEVCLKVQPKIFFILRMGHPFCSPKAFTH